MKSDPAIGRCKRIEATRGLLACLLAGSALVAIAQTQAAAQNPNNAFQQRQSGDDLATPEDQPTRQPRYRLDPNGDGTPDDGTSPDGVKPAQSRIGSTPTYGLPAANGAADTGYDFAQSQTQESETLSRPAQAKTLARPRHPRSRRYGDDNDNADAAAAGAAAILHREQDPDRAGDGRHRVGQPTRRRLKPDDDPFGAIGDYAGSFLVKSALEISGGYDSNPGRFVTEKGSPFYVIAPELLVVSDWSRHALVADLRGSFTGYGNTFPPPTDGTISGVPTNVDRPDFTGHVDGRLDVTSDTRITGQARLRVATDNPGSPNIQAGLAKYPVYVSTGATLGIDQNFNRLQVSAGATFDHTVYQDSKLTNGLSTSNDDRNFNQYGGIARVSYDVMPGLKPFAEVEGDTRVHETFVDRFGYQRNSDGGYVKAGTSFELTRLVTGEISVGYTLRNYQDSRLDRLQGLLTSALVSWSVSPLTTAKFVFRHAGRRIDAGRRARRSRAHLHRGGRS